MFISFIFVGEMCVFVSRPMTIVSFPLKNSETPKRVVDLPLERHIPKQNNGNRRGFRRKKVTKTTLNNGKIVEDFACEAKFLHFFIIHHFSSFSRFFFFSFFQFFHCFRFFPFFHFFIFLHFLSFSFIFLHFLSFFLCWMLQQNLIFFWASISLRFLMTALM